MDKDLKSSLESAISTARIESYRNGGDDQAMLANYLRNIVISESLYPVLQAFEITFRNSLHAGLTNRFGSENWYDSEEFTQLASVARHLHAVSEAKRSLVRDGKNAPHSTDHVVSRLNFGFWHGLLNRPFEVSLWQPNGWSLVSETFPYAPRRFRNRQQLWTRIDHIRVLRNRVMHYEPIWSRADITSDHTTIADTIEWINPDMRRIIALIDRFPTVWDEKFTAIEEQIKRTLQ